MSSAQVNAAHAGSGEALELHLQKKAGIVTLTLSQTAEDVIKIRLLEQGQQLLE